MAEYSSLTSTAAFMKLAAPNREGANKWGTMPDFTEENFKTRDGLSIYYRDYGEPKTTAMPVLILSGSTSNSRSADTVAKHIAKGRRVLSMDWRGHGHSDWDPDYKNYLYETDAEDVLELLAHEGMASAILIGSSRGGIISMHLADSNPEVLAGVVLNDIAPVVAPAGRARLQRTVGYADDYDSFEDAGVAWRDSHGGGVEGLSADDFTRIAKVYFRKNDEGRIVADCDPGYARAFREIPRMSDLWSKFEGLKPIPVLALRGANSDIVDVETFKQMAEVKPDIQQATIPGRAHCPFLDEPESLTAIDAFLAQY